MKTPTLNQLRQGAPQGSLIMLDNSKMELPIPDYRKAFYLRYISPRLVSCMIAVRLPNFNWSGINRTSMLCC